MFQRSTKSDRSHKDHNSHLGYRRKIAKPFSPSIYHKKPTCRRCRGRKGLLLAGVVIAAVLPNLKIDRFLIKIYTRHVELMEFQKTAAHQEKMFFNTTTTTTYLPLQPLDLEPLTSQNDMEHYTIRMNTFQRTDQLRLSLAHYQTCEGAQHIHVVWCLAQGNPPSWLVDMSNDRNNTVLLETHTINSLNERFRILATTSSTMAILSIDDDVLRPCIALDHAFGLWTQHPSSMVGFDPRAIVDDGDDTSWRYTLTAETLRRNAYGLVLTKSAFLHRDYLRGYLSSTTSSGVMNAIRSVVDANMNCEDIAMSLYVTAVQQQHPPPVVVDFWAQEHSLVALAGGDGGAISGTRRLHLRQRSWCLNLFAEKLGLKKQGYKNHVLFPPDKKKSRDYYFAVGYRPFSTTTIAQSQRRAQAGLVVQRWKGLSTAALEAELQEMLQRMAAPALQQNLIVLRDNRYLQVPPDVLAKTTTNITTNSRNPDGAA